MHLALGLVAGNKAEKPVQRPVGVSSRQKMAESGEVERPQVELKLMMMPALHAIMAGTKWRMTLATPLTLVSKRRRS